MHGDRQLGRSRGGKSKGRARARMMEKRRESSACKILKVGGVGI